ncbi:hypothetical protein FHR83_003050 [Actinoplanes campanulatus]|uniref:Uncharacterized protein n=1 Tax=Actinoplanes campanulatus TaxID=113559 RepID=A0A7W5AFH7_9ACTN|nr:hypothetical protein [Actinoplanes campanulatus]MBB3095387.1 hypothetical protein [Actinoplanes campanulatus]GGN41835.1 hypothetical protein GCM10010109_72330 [Actinoplanes campanulatus]GID34991.1 hypothetical protein Aca09nite_14970 [Actinoplanes campanulatus]
MRGRVAGLTATDRGCHRNGTGTVGGRRAGEQSLERVAAPALPRVHFVAVAPPPRHPEPEPDVHPASGVAVL